MEYIIPEIISTEPTSFGFVEHCRQGAYRYDIWHDKDGGIISMKYSTLSIKRELAKLGKWEAAKSLIEASGVWDDFILANYLSEDDPVFVAAKASFVAKGILVREELDDMLLRCAWFAD